MNDHSGWIETRFGKMKLRRILLFQWKLLQKFAVGKKLAISVIRDEIITIRRITRSLREEVEGRSYASIKYASWGWLRNKRLSSMLLLR